MSEQTKPRNVVEDRRPGVRKALEALLQAEAEFLQTCGWFRSPDGWSHPRHPRMVLTVAQAVEEERRQIVREQLLGR